MVVVVGVVVCDAVPVVDNVVDGVLVWEVLLPRRWSFVNVAVLVSDDVAVVVAYDS